MNPLGRAHVPDVARVEAQLSELWRDASSGTDPVTRACTLNLVVVCDDGANALQSQTGLVARIAETEPGRAIVVAFPDGDGASEGLDVYVSAHCHRGAGGAQICSEQVTMEARGAGRDLIPVTVLQLLVGDLPVYTLWRRGELHDDPLLAGLLEVSDRFIVNSADQGDPSAALSALDRISAGAAGRGRAADITWDRLEPWREAVAMLFDAPRLRPGLDRIRALSIASGGSAIQGRPSAAGACLAGWLASRLGWTLDAKGALRRDDGKQLEVSFTQDTSIPEGEIAAARIETELDGARATFVAQRTDDDADMVTLCVEPARTAIPPWRIKLPARDEAALLCGMLQRRHDDPIFDRAVRLAAQLAARLT
jgi:glucose-6-phosphate dehydrogenase assembly protein OpcA